MAQLEPLDLSIRARNPDYHDKTRDIETALAWNAVRKTLENMGRIELVEYIKSVKISEKYITIFTEKPIVNSELKIYTEDILSRLNTSLESIGSIKKIGVRMR